MSPIDVSRDQLDRRPARETPAGTVGTYKETLERAVALAPALRVDRAALESIPPAESRPVRPAAIRRSASAVAVIAAAAGALLFAPAASTPVVALGTAFGLASAAAGDRLGAALRRLLTPAPWRQRAALALATVMPAVEAALIVVAATLVAESVFAGLGLAAAAVALAFISHATRRRDAEIEARAAAHAEARRRLDATDQAVRRAMAALRVAHAADLARVTSEMGRPPVLLCHTAPRKNERPAGAAYAPQKESKGIRNVALRRHKPGILTSTLRRKYFLESPFASASFSAEFGGYRVGAFPDEEGIENH